MLKIPGIGKTDLTCEIIYDSFTCDNYRFLNNFQSQLLDILYCYMIFLISYSTLEINLVFPRTHVLFSI